MPHKVNAVCVIHANYFFLFYFLRFLKKIADDHCSSIAKNSFNHIKHNVHTTFYYWSELTWNSTFDGSIYYVSYLHILRFYFAWQNFLPLIFSSSLLQTRLLYWLIICVFNLSQKTKDGGKNILKGFQTPWQASWKYFFITMSQRL